MREEAGDQTAPAQGVLSPVRSMAGDYGEERLTMKITPEMQLLNWLEVNPDRAC